MLSKKGFVIDKSKLTQTQITKLKNDLYVRPMVFGSNHFTQADFFYVYRESPHKFRVPRFYGQENFGISSSTFSCTSIDVSFTGTLKDSLHQNDAVNACVNTLHTRGGGLLSLPTGYGKTTCALAVLARIGVKTLIIVHKEFLMNQWKERIAQFLPSATVGILRQHKCDTQKDITIAMLQTLCSKDFPPGTFDTFGLTLIDETHHICSRVFSQSMFSFTTKYILGLSATPERKDNLTYVLHWFIGPTCFSVKREDQVGVQVNQIMYTSPIYDDPVPQNIANKVNLPEVVNIIVQIENRNSMIIKLIIESLVEKRNIILLTERRGHCELLYSLLQNELPSVNAGLYMGGMKQNILKENEKCDVLFATYSLAHEGLDIPKLDTLILATPKSDVVQSCGRILRETGTKKNNPLIYDIVDTWGPLVAQSRKRQAFYRKSGFNINKHNDDDTQITRLQGFSFTEDS